MQQFAPSHSLLGIAPGFWVDWSTPHYKTKVGGAILVRDVKSPRKPYHAPSFEVIEIKTAKTKLEAEVTSTGEARQMLSLIDKQLEDKTSAPNSRRVSL